MVCQGVTCNGSCCFPGGEYGGIVLMLTVMKKGYIFVGWFSVDEPTKLTVQPVCQFVWGGKISGDPTQIGGEHTVDCMFHPGYILAMQREVAYTAVRIQLADNRRGTTRMKLKIFTTGGTIDKIYFDAKNDYQIGDPEIDALLLEANVCLDYSITSLLRKDSLEVTDDDRKLIHDAVAAEPCSHILITHGTDTMIETARCLSDIRNKTVVLTGSMQPARLRVSDAFFNVGFAVAAVQLLQPGIYVAMNGKVFDPQLSRKNVAANCFESI